MNTSLINLPWQIQVTLASGYAGYLLAYVGIRDSHKSIDTAFIALVFSLIASAVLAFVSDWNPIAAAGVAFIATCAAAILWRVLLRDWLHRLLRHSNVSWADDSPSAWARLLQNSKIPITQVAVEIENGTWLRCENAAQFNDAPFGPVILGQNGDIALYLTHIDGPGGESKALETVRDPDFGDRITYVPASRVKRVTVRYKTS